MTDTNTTETVDLLALLAEVEAEIAAGIVNPAVAEENARLAKEAAERAKRTNPKTKCYRCNGTGYLQEFHYIAAGCCFDCMGWGYRGGHL